MIPVLRCDAPREIAYGDISGDWTVGSWAEYACRENRVLLGPYRRQCLGRDTQDLWSVPDASQIRYGQLHHKTVVTISV